MEISSRYSLPATIVLLLCAVPVWFHTRSEPERDACVDANAFFLDHKIGTAVNTRNQWRFRAGDAQGRIATPFGHPVQVRVFRTFEASKLYGSPMSFGFDSMSYLVPREIRSIEAGEWVLPVQWSHFEMDGVAHLEAWTFAYDDEPTFHPLAAWWGRTWRHLVDGSTPLTVMIASAQGRPEQIERLETTAEQWFPAAWKQLRAACDS